MMCPECGVVQSWVGYYFESYYDGESEYGYHVYELACGHEKQAPAVRLGEAPGKPYAGRKTAASTRAADLAAARREETTE